MKRPPDFIFTTTWCEIKRRAATQCCHAHWETQETFLNQRISETFREVSKRFSAINFIQL